MSMRPNKNLLLNRATNFALQLIAASIACESLNCLTCAKKKKKAKHRVRILGLFDMSDMSDGVVLLAVVMPSRGTAATHTQLGGKFVC